MTTNSPFDHRPDPNIGDPLREVLTMDGEKKFVHAVLARAEAHFLGEVPNGQWWSVLGDWVRPGLAVAAGLAAAAILWTGLTPGSILPPASLANPIAESAEELTIPPWLADQTAPEVEVVLASASGF